MALAAQQSLLDELMGKGRNAAKGEKVHKLHFDDPDVCKLMLVDFCPHELFVNTRQNLGFCDKIHDLSYQKEYQTSSRFGKLGYEEEFERFMKSLVSDVERRIKRGQERLRITQGDPNSEHDPNHLKNELLSKIKDLGDKITSYVLESEELGNACRIDEAQQVLSQCEDMREEKMKLEMQLAEEQANAEMNKAMEVCSICGSFLIVGDIQSRIDEHNSGKQHAGYAKIRASLEALSQRKSGTLEKERSRNSQKEETSTRKRERSESKDEKSKRRHSPSNHRHHHDKSTKQHESSREQADHHYHKHRSSRYETNSSPKDRHHRR
ncbi:hypothetical protein I4U23_002308 [Adineta vaga]|nr:hypothetical protein I4U23_002308 [Adineta vaga]